MTSYVTMHLHNSSAGKEAMLASGVQHGPRSTAASTARTVHFFKRIA
jgi:hypothetical protein